MLPPQCTFLLVKPESNHVGARHPASTRTSLQALSGVSTATLDHRAAEEGPAQRVAARHAAAGAEPARALVGRAFTLRFVPAREDLATPASWGSPISDPRRDRGDAQPAASPWSARWASLTPASSATSCARACSQRGVAALVTDGVVRDVAGVLGTGLPVWCQGTAAPPSVAGLTFVGWQEPIDCGGVAVFPNDVISRRSGRRGADPGGAAR